MNSALRNGQRHTDTLGWKWGGGWGRGSEQTSEQFEQNAQKMGLQWFGVVEFF